MDELRSLVEAAGYEVAASIEQVRHQHPRYHIGRGKAEELAELVSKLKAEKVIFGNELKVVQIYNLAKLTGVEVIDRFQLILEIFAKRASTKEAKLQIALARLKYELAHAKEKVRLARMGEQPGFLGLGKYEVDVYYETVKRQLKSIQNKLRRIRRTRELHRARRRKLELPSVSLAGYTNSGKSTLFNRLAEENTPTDSTLFTTLSTTTRAIDLFGERVLLTDTVGFIDRLPLTLIEAFHSTLEETIFSDLILLVVDVSEPIGDVKRKVTCCLDTIQQIGASGIPIITVLNKIDMISKDELSEKMDRLRGLSPNLTPISALYGINLKPLMERMARYLTRMVKSSFTLPVNDESIAILSWISSHAKIENIQYLEGSVNVQFKGLPNFIDKVRSRIEELGGMFKSG